MTAEGPLRVPYRAERKPQSVTQVQTYRIMLVEDEQKIAEILRDELARYGYAVSIAQEFRAIKDEFLRVQPDLVLLDINLPQFDGFYWCRQIRTLSKVPILFVSAREGDLDQVRALEHGGDDFITKPFNLELVLAKIRSMLRRTYGEYALGRDEKLARVGGLLLHKGQNRISLGEAELELTPKEFTLLSCLAERAGEIVSREELLEALWDDDFVDDNTLTVNVTRLRRRMEELGLPQAIETKRGQGYRLNLREERGQP